MKSNKRIEDILKESMPSESLTVFVGDCLYHD